MLCKGSIVVSRVGKKVFKTLNFPFHTLHPHYITTCPPHPSTNPTLHSCAPSLHLHTVHPAKPPEDCNLVNTDSVVFCRSHVTREDDDSADELTRFTAARFSTTPIKELSNSVKTSHGVSQQSPLIGREDGCVPVSGSKNGLFCFYHCLNWFRFQLLI